MTARNHQGNDSRIQFIDVVEMRAFPDGILFDNMAVNLLGGANPGDGAGAGFHWDENSTAAEDAPSSVGTVVKLTNTPVGRFIRTDQESVSVLDFGADPTGLTDSHASFVSATAALRTVNIPKGLYYLSQSLTTSSAETDAIIIQGEGTAQTVLMFRSTSGVGLLGGQQRIKDLTIIDGDSYSTLPTTIEGAASGDGLVRGNITASTVGLNLDRSDQRGDNVQVMGFAEGILNSNTKFYSILIKCIARKNLKGHVSGSIDLEDAPNFNFSIGCRYSTNYEMNGHVRTGFHVYDKCSMEACADYHPDHINFPNGGLYAGPLGHAALTEPYFEQNNYYNANPRGVGRSFQNISPSNLFFAPVDIDRTQIGARTNNLLKPPHLSPWESTIGGAASVAVSVSKISDDRRYSTVTVTGAGGVSKVLASEWNTTVRGITPREKGADFRIKWGIWVRYVTDNFSTSKPEINIRVTDVSAGGYQITDDSQMNVSGDGTNGETKVNALGLSSTITSVVVDSVSNPSNTDITVSGALFLDQVKVGMTIVNTSTADSSARLGQKSIIKKVTSNTVLNIDGDSFNAADTFVIDGWQYIGGLHAIQNTLTTGDALESIRMQIDLEIASVDCSSANRIIDISEPHMEFMYAQSNGNDMYGETPCNLSNANVSNPPTDAELDTLFGTPAQAGSGFEILLDDAGAGANVYKVWSDGANWWYDTLTKAV